MFATIAVNPVTATVAVLELKRSDGAILKLDSTHTLTALNPNGTVRKLYGLVSEAGDFIDAADDFLAGAVRTSDPIAVQYQDTLAGVDQAVQSAANLETGSASYDAVDASEERSAWAGASDDVGPGNTEAEILSGADGYSEGAPA